MATVPPDRINFVDKNYARRRFLALLKHVSNSRGAHAHKHLDKIRSADAEERHIRFAGNRSSKQRFTGSRRADHQHALRNSSTQLLKFFRILQEIHDLLNFLFGLLDAGDVFKGHSVAVACKHPSLALSEIERPFSGIPNLLPEKEVQNQEEQGDG